VDTLIKVLRENNEYELFTVLGPSSAELIWSEDNVNDRNARENFLQRYGEKHNLERVEETKVILHVGNNDWKFPIPIVQVDNYWYFDTKQGKKELLSRRIGKNERETTQTCMAIVDAERKYAAMTHDGGGLPEYAQKFSSAEGKRDGLYWDVKPGETQSPLGPLIAKAQSEGYRKKEKPIPYNGYFFRILTSQGKDAYGGAYSYLVKSRMVGGFALIAYPAIYGVSGMKTFIVNHEGIVYEKDLGSNTVKQAKAMKVFNPDKTWAKVK